MKEVATTDARLVGCFGMTASTSEAGDLRITCSCGAEVYPDNTSVDTAQASMLPWLRVHAPQWLRKELRAPSAAP